ncbi:hypothetical protein BCR43DRAFT_487411 [Syncephalastrum racemosum]|uniref:CBF1-interacting co-repressor CIR N-terminal domain-containing protein n=1 Tax=Syncephalastrum racemosum TaxID=13706 RepID=A0A1X2HQS8_SYNRA|nr:hypothetical protein BCR43DRAFT_487411 [Syncephalastrum racemosum]
MNILPHKSWHVYNKKNIERVRKDEAKAKEEEDKQAKRAAKAESEARLTQLRERARARLSEGGEGSSSALVVRQEEHINLFKPEEDEAGNEERQKEQREKDQAWDRKVTMYLDQSVHDKERPWYAKKEYDKYGHLKKHKSKDNDDDKRRKRKHHNRIELDDDPLAIINKRLKKSEKYAESKKHKEVQGGSSIEALRAQRRAREQREQQRTRQMVYGDTPPAQVPDSYHSQFNPSETASAHARRQTRRSDRH